MIGERDADCGGLYRAKRRELLALVASLTDDELEVTVPATPAWSVRDSVAHLVGLAADLNASRFPEGDPDAWTDEQVRSRRGRPIPQLAAEWEAEAPTFEHGLELFGDEIGSHYLGDLLQHAADIRQALGRGPLADDEALAVALDHYLRAFDLALVDAGAGSVAVEIPHERWVLGTGPVVASVRTQRFELFRCLGGRRSVRQLRAMDWSGDPEPIVPLMSAYPPPGDDLTES